MRAVPGYSFNASIPWLFLHLGAVGYRAFDAFPSERGGE
jgi:hypothetical protein